MFQIYFNSYLHYCFLLHPQVENQGALRTTERDALLQASLQFSPSSFPFNLLIAENQKLRQQFAIANQQGAVAMEKEGEVRNLEEVDRNNQIS